MDKSHELRGNKKSMVEPSTPHRIFPKQNELNQKKNCNFKPAANNHKQVNTDSLDKAMNDLLDICKQYNDKLMTKTKATKTPPANVPNENSNLMSSAFKTTKPTTTTDCDNNYKQNNLNDIESAKNVMKTGPNSTISRSGSIERLQQQQGELQAQLDEVLQVAKSLASKQKRKLKCILEEDSNISRNDQVAQKEDEDGGDDEDELIEFQQIENELRISELNRQLDTIQEELRIRLYKRLFSNTNNTRFVQKNQTSSQDCARRSSHTDDSSPSSSSCSDEPTTSSNSAPYYNSANSDLERIEEDEEDCQDYYNDSERFRTIYEEKLSPMIHGHQQASTNNSFVTERKMDINSDFYSKHSTFDFQSTIEDGITSSRQVTQNQQSVYSDIDFNTGKCSNNDSSFNSSFSGKGDKGSGTSRTSRPLTLYLPKPDEEIDLADHVQALGHDLSIISTDMKLDLNCASGYLWKCCSNNNKKWLKRFFYLDRKSQTLSYYENEAQLVKKNNPRNSIHFDEICDVYVDHKLSGLAEKDRSTKRKNYVFVLATIKRKYLLASSRAETMRAWIDTLFTAAKANDYFQQISTMDDQPDNIYESY